MEDILDIFTQITLFDIKEYLQKVQSFMNQEKVLIVSYYSGEIDSLDKQAFEKFENLKREDERVFELYRIHKKRFSSTVELWDLVSLLEKIRKNLRTIENAPRWSRSSINQFGVSNSFETPYLMKKKQSLKTISKGTSRTWQEIAFDNRLKEVDYTAEGGEVISLKIPIDNESLLVKSVVDIMVGENIKGKDLDQRLSWDIQSNDLKILSPKETALQAVNILANLKKNQHPLYPNDGLNKETMVATNVSLLNFPIFTRQLTTTFGTDDSLKNFNITNISRDQDNFVVTFTIDSRDSESLDQFTYNY